MICEQIGGQASIGKIARQEVEFALNAGWQVTVVANYLDPVLQREVEWLRLYVPPRSFAFQWLSGRYWIKKALGTRTFDVVHGHQPQVADLTDVYQCHFLTRAAYERGCLYDGQGVKRWLEVSQKRVVLAAEDYFYRRWNPRTLMLYDSHLTRDCFERFYGVPPFCQTLIYASPEERFATSDERAAARTRWLGQSRAGIVAGFLGGLVERKGYRRILHSLTGETDVFLLMGGPNSDGFCAPELKENMRSVGECRDIDSFYAACDVLLVPSLFEPFGLVASEAIARGVPVIATDEVGALPHILEHGAGARWNPTEPLVPIIRSLVESPARFRDGCARYNRAYSAVQHDRALSGFYQEAKARKHFEGAAAST